MFPKVPELSRVRGSGQPHRGDRRRGGEPTQHHYLPAGFQLTGREKNTPPLSAHKISFMNNS